MSELDILFWLFVLLLAGLGYAIEAGLANQHRSLLLSTMASVTLASVYLMFAVEDTSSFDTTRPDAVPTEVDEGEDDFGEFEFGGKKKKKRTASSVSRQDTTIKPRTLSESELIKGPISDCEGCPTMVLVHGGGFALGSPPDEAGRGESEGPSRNVRVARDFLIGQFEVTRDQYAMFVKESNYIGSRTCLIDDRRIAGANWEQPGFPQTGKHPVVCISWRDAKSYLVWLKSKTGKPYRLPSETEWEYSARAGTKTAYSFGPQFRPTMVNAGKQRRGTMVVGENGFNKFGIGDMHGNVAEMLEDCWSQDLSFVPDGGRPLGMLGDCSQRAMRGGGWDSPPEHTRSAARGASGENAALNSVGFRVARDVIDMIEEKGKFVPVKK